VEFAIRIVALGVVPKHRRASLIFLWPFLGVPLYFIFGSWWAMGRRLDDDPEASALVEAILKDSAKPEPTSYETPDGSDDDTASLMRLTGSLSGFPDSCGHVVALHNETADTFRAMAASIDRATHHVNALYFQTSWDEYSAPFYEALERAKARGVDKLQP
jgi:Phosphatidylserine/phosphatidylglycerophosphate/cardiolipin synthases and related enzymes